MVLCTLKNAEEYVCVNKNKGYKLNAFVVVYSHIGFENSHLY